MAKGRRGRRIVLGDLPGDVLESIMGLVPLQDLVSARRTCKAMRDAADTVCRGRGLRVDGKEGLSVEACWRQFEDSRTVGAALWLCEALKASWLHHLACVGSPYQVAHALRLGEAVDGSRKHTKATYRTRGWYDSFVRDGLASMSPLMVACALGRGDVAEVLLEARARVVIAARGRYSSALIHATKGGHVDVMRMLLDKIPFGAPKWRIEWGSRMGKEGGKWNKTALDVRDGVGSALDYASAGGHMAAVELLLEEGASIDIGIRVTTALMRAAARGHRDVVKALIKAGADVEVVDREELTALGHAVMHGHADVARVLLNAGAKVLDRDYDEGPLTCAVKGGYTEVFEVLIGAGLSVNAMTLMLPCAVSNGHTDLVQKFLGAGAEVDVVDERTGMTALMLAVRGGHKDICDMLIRGGAHLDNVDRKKMTALMHAARGGHKDICEMLVREGADVDSADEEDIKALMYTARWGYKDTCDMLIREGTDMDSADDDERTAFLTRDDLRDDLWCGDV